MVLGDGLTTIGEYKLPMPTRQEEFSLAFLHAITASVGYAIEKPRVDMYGIDVHITQGIRPSNSTEHPPHYEMLVAQVKCTYAHQPKNGFIDYSLGVKTYNLLRQRCTNPRILVVVHVPKESDSWTHTGTDCLTLFHSAYWMSLLNYPETTNRDKITVKIPTSQKLTPKELDRIMINLAQGTLP